MNTQANPCIALRITRVDDVAQDIRSFELAAPDGAALPPFTPGAHIRVQTPCGAVRKYSLCNAAAERQRYVIAVKREPGGQGGSLSMHAQAQVGGTLLVAPPDNAFALVDKASAYLFIAGGIGITPIISMIRSLAPSAPTPWRLYYLTRTPEATAFASELTQPRLQRHVQIHHDHGNPAQSFDLWPVLEKPDRAHIYCCGPRALMDSVRDMSGHWSARNVHFESFSEGAGTRPDDRPFRVLLARSGRSFVVPVGQSILATLRAHGCTARSSCESGSCGTCRTTLLAGTAEHRDLVLQPEEMAGQIMICVSRAQSPELVLDL